MQLLLSMFFVVAGCATVTSPDTKVLVHGEEKASNRLDSQYLGTLEFPHSGSIFEVQLDLIPKSENFQESIFSAVLKTSPRGHKEYWAQFFPLVYYSKADQKLKFPKKWREFTIASLDLVSDTLSGRMESGEQIGELIIKASSGIHKRQKSGLTAVYVSQCADSDQILALQAHLGSDMVDFRSKYPVTGTLGVRNEKICESSEYCVEEVYNAGHWYPVRGLLELHTSRGHRSCRLDGDSLACGGCFFKRKTEKDDGESAIPTSKLALPKELEDSEGDLISEALQSSSQIAGQYFGYINNTHLGKAQLLAVNVSAKSITQTAGLNRELVGKPDYGLTLSSVATLYLGQGDSNEFVVYKFAEELLPNPLGTVTLTGGGDGILYIASWDDGGIIGNWYSKSFGYVGPVFLEKESIPERGSWPQISRLGGLYHNTQYTIELHVASDISQQDYSRHPLQIFGWVRENVEGSHRRIIESGEFDFFTEELTLKMADGGFISGTFSGDAILLNWPEKVRYGVPVKSFNWLTFSKTIPPEIAGKI